MLHLRRSTPSLFDLPFSCCLVSLVEGVYSVYLLIYYWEKMKGIWKSQVKSFDPKAAKRLVDEVVLFLFGELECLIAVVTHDVQKIKNNQKTKFCGKVVSYDDWI